MKEELEHLENLVVLHLSLQKKKILLVTSHTTHITTVLNVEFVTNRRKAVVDDKAKYTLPPVSRD
jgi:hypothetical protein